MEGGMGMFENLMRQSSLKSLFGGGRKSDDSSSEDPPTLIPQLSPMANSVVARCSKILLTSAEELQIKFETELPEHAKQTSSYARNLLEYCSYQALHAVTARASHLADKEFRRLTYDMMLAWDDPGVGTEDSFKEASCSGTSASEDEDGGSLFYTNSTCMAIQVDGRKTVGREAFARIAPACPAVADIITVHNLFDALTINSCGRLHFIIYDKYIGSLNKVLRNAKSLTAPPSTSNLQLVEGEIIIDVDGTVPTQPIFQHTGISAWPGRLTLSNRAIYCEPLGVGSYDKAVVYDLSMDLKQVIKPELTGPLGARLFDTAVMYKATSISEPVYLEFAEFKGHSRRDYWLSIILEIFHVHSFIRKFSLKENQQAEALAKATLGIFRYRAVKEAFHFMPSHFKTLLPFSLADNLPKGDEILDALARHLELLDRTVQTNNDPEISSHLQLQAGSLQVFLVTLVRFGFLLPNEVDGASQTGYHVGDVYVGEKSPLELAVKWSISASGRAEAAQATVDQVKVEGIDTNIAVMKELLFPFIELAGRLDVLASWEDPLKSTMFLALVSYGVYRDWVKYTLPCIFVFLAAIMLWHKHKSKNKAVEAFRVSPPPSKNPVEQLITLQEAISEFEAHVREGNIILLKLRALLFAAFPQATDTVVLSLIATAAVCAFVPLKHVVILVLLEAYTRQMPLRRHSSEKLIRRLKEWWVRIPAAPVLLISPEESKKMK
ncbi:hypothetical protein QJS04_geneDACA019235 [Acorus gramineus]|uniref:Uncharacterized protein n=1 Tax=Acorus gramineus TaxID=55184 RepID=A0AAV9A086_ACOGR|nr:hypothetical protein QJS04_geneDACA019235 [Acorus gramineus]